MIVTLISLKNLKIILKTNMVIEERHQGASRMLVMFCFLNPVMGTRALILVFVFHILLYSVKN